MATTQNNQNQVAQDQAQPADQAKSVEVSSADAAQKSKAERQAQQIPERRDEVVAPGEVGKSPVQRDQENLDAKTKPVVAPVGGQKDGAYGADPADAEQSPSKVWADYASKQEELYKKNTGAPIERNDDGTVKP